MRFLRLLVSGLIAPWFLPRLYAAGEVSLDAHGGGGYAISTTPGSFNTVNLPGNGVPADGTVSFIGGDSLFVPPGFNYFANISGQGQAVYGELTGRMGLDLSAFPDTLGAQVSYGHSAASGNVDMTFNDIGVVTSPTLPAGAPVSISFTVHVATDGGGILAGHPPTTDSLGVIDQGMARGTLKIVDETTHNTFQSSTFTRGVNTFIFNTAVGRRLDIKDNFNVYMGGFAGRDGPNEDVLYNFYPDVFGSILGNSTLYVGGPDGLGIVADSGHDYSHVAHVSSFVPLLTAQSGITAVPNSGATFKTFDSKVSAVPLGGVFHAITSASQDGIYAFDSTGIQTVADHNTPIPGGIGNFTSFKPGNFIPTEPCRSGDNVAFGGVGANDQQGIYARLGGALVALADKNTAIPGGSGNFTAFADTGFPPDPCISGDNIAFRGFGSSNQKGIYLYSNQALARVADKTTDIPGGNGKFTSFGLDSVPVDPCISADTVMFFGAGGPGQTGLYKSVAGAAPTVVADAQTAIPGAADPFLFFHAFSLDPTDPANLAFIGGNRTTRGVYASLAGGPLVSIADTSVNFPGTSSLFTDFTAVSIDPTDIAFIGFSAGGDQGLFAAINGQLIDLINVGDTYEGKIISDLDISAGGLTQAAGGPRVYFRATFDDKSMDILSVDVPEPDTPTLTVDLLMGLLLCCHGRRVRGGCSDIAWKG